MRAAAGLRLPIDLPLVLDLPLDGRVLSFNVALSFAAAVLFGLVPALQATKANLTDVLKESASANQTRGVAWRNGLIVAQVAVSLVLLTGAGLMWRALAQAQDMALGFTPRGAVEATFDLRLQGYTPEQGRELQRRLLDAVRGLPGVTDAALADILPIDLHFSRTSVYSEAMLAQRDVRAPRVYSSVISPGYFQTMRTPLREGRDFSERDDEASVPVAIVNRSLANRLWPGSNAVGRRVRVGSVSAWPLANLAGGQRARNDLEIVGVVQDGKYASFGDDGAPAIYRPLRQAYSGTTSIVARTDGDVGTAVAAVRGAVRSIDPNMPLASARSLDERLSIPLLPARVAAMALASFGALALVLAAVGLYGIMSYSVSSRTHEIGIRVALGAKPRDVMRLILGEGGRLIAVGIVAGVVLALIGTRLLKALLFGVSAADPATYLAVVVVLAAVALVACWIPARRALKADPLEALRAN
jgi:predicted permease